MNSREVEFARQLASNEKKTRDKCVKKLTTWLHYRSSQPSGFEENDMMKLWKGLFYCMWMSDKPLVQEELATNISKLIHSFSRTESAFKFIETFFGTIRREWEGLDRLRLDKYYLLIQSVVRECFCLLKTNKWKESVVGDLAAVIDRGVLSCADCVQADGIRTHVVEKFILELVPLADEKLSPDALNILLQPLCLFAGRTEKFGDVMSFVKTVLDPLIDRPSVHDRYVGDVTLQVDHNKVAEMLFSVAANQKTRGKNRQKLFQMKRKFVARHEKAVRDEAAHVKRQDESMEMENANDSSVTSSENVTNVGSNESDECETTLEDEECETKVKKSGKRNRRKGKRKGTPFCWGKVPAGENDETSLSEHDQDSSLVSDSSSDSTVTFKFNRDLQSNVQSPSSVLVSTPKAKLDFSDVANSSDLINEESASWYNDRIRRARERWRQRQEFEVLARSVRAVSENRRGLRAARKMSIEHWNDVMSDGDEKAEKCDEVADRHEAKKKRVSFASTEVQVQEFRKNTFVSSSQSHDGTRMPHKGVLKTSPSSASPSSCTLPLMKHPRRTKMTMNVRGNLKKTADSV